MPTLTGYPLSRQQRRIWTRTRGSEPARSRCLLRISEKLRVDRFRQALADAVARHDILRTTFIVPPGADEPLQVPGAAAQIEWDVRDAPGTHPADLLRAVVAGAAIQASLITDARAHARYLLLTAPALMTDAVGLWHLAVEAATLYDGQSLEEPVQYAAYGEWQRSTAATSASASPSSSADADQTPPIRLPYERAVPREQSQIVRADLEPGVLARLGHEAAQRGAGLASALVAVWHAVAYRHTQQEALVSAHLIDARASLDELRGAVGPYSFLTRVKTDAGDDVTIAELAVSAARAIRQAAVRGPIDEGEDTREPAGGGDPGASMMVTAYADIWRASFGKIDLAVECLADDCEPTRLSLSWIGAGTAWLIADGRMPSAYLSALTQQLAACVSAAASDFSAEIGTLSMLGVTAREALVRAVNRTDCQLPADRYIDLFDAAVRRRPTAVALEWNGGQWTYRELDTRARTVARALLAQGAGPETIVAVPADNSPAMIVGLLGVLKAGAAYLPVDPTAPRPRLAFMLADAGVRLATSSSSSALVEVFADAGICVIESEGEDESSTSPAPHVASGHLAAYVIYTSGTTGRPKGVVVTNRGLVNYVRWAADAYAAAEGVTPVHTTLTFDLTVTSVLVPLAAGGTVALLDGLLEPGRVDALTDAVRARADLGLVKLTPAHLSLLSAVLPAAAAGHTRLLVVGGETLAPAALAFWREHAPHVRIVNEYGPTETVVGCATADACAPQAVALTSVPIGHPIANTQLYIVDRAMNPVGVGVAGELCIGGLGVARGYLRQPALTAAAFVPDPFAAHRGARLYRSGDRARWLPDGEIECLGRVDDQVKIRGHRIEPAEIVAVLRSHAAVTAADVCAAGDADARTLEAFVTLRPGTPCSADDLRDHLAAQLPAYLLPRLHIVPAMPLTRHGKIDRRALCALLEDDRESRPASMDEVESLVQAVCCRVLRREAVRPEDDFFDAGGHSLTAAQVIAHVNGVLDVQLPLSSLFEHPVVADFARLARAALRTRSGVAAPPMTPVPDRDRASLPLSYAQERVWFMEQLQPGGPAYTLFWAVRLRGRLDVDALGRTFEDLTRRHAILRTRFTIVNGQPRQQIAPPSPWTLVLEPIEGEDEAARLAAAQREVQEASARGFDLANEPPIRVRLLSLGADDVVLVVAMHHIVSDGWSMGILTREMTALYDAFREGRPSPLVDLRLQYADYAMWQRAWLTGERLERHLQYWRRQLAGAPPLTALPFDRPRPPEPSGLGASLTFSIDEGLTAQVRQGSRLESATPFMTLLAAYGILLHAYGGAEDIVVGADDANRSREETEPLIGFFVNQLALRIDLSANPSGRRLLARVRETTLGAYAHNAAPFEKVVDALGIPRTLAYTPVFQAKIVMQPASAVSWHTVIPHTGATWGGGAVETQPVRAASGTAKYDLTFTFTERARTIDARVEFRTELFDRATIDTMASRFVAVLRALTADVERPLATLTSHAIAMARPTDDRATAAAAAGATDDRSRFAGARQRVVVRH